MLSVRDLVRQIPAEWQENVKHRSRITYARFLDQIRDPARESPDRARGSGGCRRSPTSSTAGAHDLPPERVHLVTVPPPGGPPDAAVAAVQHGLRPRRPRPRPRGRAGQPVPRRPRDRAGAPDQPARQPRASRRADYRPLVRELLAHQTLSRRRRLAAAGAAAGPAPVGRGAHGVLGRRDRAARATTSSATSTTSPARRRSRDYVDPDHPRRGARSPTRRSTRSRRCCSRTPGCAPTRSELQAELDEAQRRARAVLPAPDVPLARAHACAGCRAAASAAGCWRSTAGRAGRSSRSA